MPNAVTFSAKPSATASGPARFQCRETGIIYSVHRSPRGYTATRAGEPIGHRPNHSDARTLMQQTASLDFLSAQASSAFADA